jgi:hypothetical protein
MHGLGINEDKRKDHRTRIFKLHVESADESIIFWLEVIICDRMNQKGVSEPKVNKGYPTHKGSVLVP